MSSDSTIVGCEVIDLRFPTSDGLHGSDAMHADPDYSAAYVVLHTEGCTAGGTALEGHGLTSTLGRGTDLCAAAAKRLGELAVAMTLRQITSDFAGFWRRLASDSQFRWFEEWFISPRPRRSTPFGTCGVGSKRSRSGS